MTNRRKLNVVLDSVVAVSAFLTEGLTADLVSQCQENVNLYTAVEILQEIRYVLLDKPHLRNRYAYSPEKVENFIDYLKDISIIVAQLPEAIIIPTSFNKLGCESLIESPSLKEYSAAIIITVYLHLKQVLD